MYRTRNSGNHSCDAELETVTDSKVPVNDHPVIDWSVSDLLQIFVAVYHHLYLYLFRLPTSISHCYIAVII